MNIFINYLLSEVWSAIAPDLVSKMWITTPLVMLCFLFSQWFISGLKDTKPPSVPQREHRVVLAGCWILPSQVMCFIVAANSFFMIEYWGLAEAVKLLRVHLISRLSLR